MDSSIVVPEFVDARVGPRGSLENLSQAEIGKLLDSGQGGLYPLFRKCALAVLNSGNLSLRIRRVFALTTHAAHWFLEQGFRAADVAALPTRRQALYNWRRGSKVCLKRI